MSLNHVFDRKIWNYTKYVISLHLQSNIILNHLNNMKHRTLFLSALALLTLAAFGGAKAAIEAEPQDSPELIFVPDIEDDNPLDLSDGKDNHKNFFPVWIPEHQIQDNDGVLVYDMTLVDDMPFQQLFQPLPGKPVDMNEVARVIIYDLNKDGHSDALICLGSYGDDHTMYFDAYVWDVDQFSFEYVEDFRTIPNPRIDENNGTLVGRNGKDRQIWKFDGLDKVEKTSEVKDFY